MVLGSQPHVSLLHNWKIFMENIKYPNSILFLLIQILYDHLKAAVTYNMDLD